jgi:hypothetical protein
MAFLTVFPPEILCSITERLDGYGIANLWFSGDKNLLGRLSNGGVTVFKVTLSRNKRIFWPTLVSKFNRLLRLNVKIDSYDSELEVRKVDLYSLSPTLEFLHLKFMNAELVFLGLKLIVTDSHPDPIWSPPTSGNIVIDPFSICDHLPNLQYLSLNGDSALADDFLTTLPSTLHTLKLAQNRGITRHGIPMLPSSLTKLSLGTNLSLGAGTDFPPNLTYLDMRSTNNISSEFLDKLPISLTFLDISQCESDMTDLVHRLPKNLEYLGLRWNGSLSGQLFASLPRSLRHLHANYQSILTNAIMIDLPPNLETLVTRDSNRLSDSSMTLLPRTITKLDLRKCSELTAQCLTDLPPTIRVLKIILPLHSTG